jgi:hypothetical protein
MHFRQANTLEDIESAEDEAASQAPTQPAKVGKIVNVIKSRSICGSRSLTRACASQNRQLLTRRDPTFPSNKN